MRVEPEEIMNEIDEEFRSEEEEVVVEEKVE